MKRLTALQRVCLCGYRRGLNRALAASRADAARLDDHLAALKDRYRRLVRALRSDRQRYAAIEAGLAATEDTQLWLQ
jgi:hypothetical protein